MTATRAFHPHIVLMFDFDYTLASDSLTTLLEVVGIEREQWSHDRVAPLARAGWDEILARGYAAIEAAKEAGQPLTAGILAEAGRRIEAFPGVEELFDHLRSTAASIDDGISVEFGVLSSGFADVMTEAALCRHFDRVWGSSFHCDDEGRVDFVKRTITHPEKALYLEALAKGQSIEGANSPRQAGAPVPEREMHVPFDQMIYVGDGGSDLQAFEFLESRGGIALAVRKDGSFAATRQMRDAQRVENLAAPDFSEGTELLRSLDLAVASAASRVALRRLGLHE